ncbi:hypothetical protein M0R04_15275 [Candidatus Dojkabacteria bacterium]|jgi:hypothetical protein|nr:hypothetical protein [Candidatus Dojkabacteria bacterium]
MANLLKNRNLQVTNLQKKEVAVISDFLTAPARYGIVEPVAGDIACLLVERTETKRLSNETIKSKVRTISLTLLTSALSAYEPKSGGVAVGTGSKGKTFTLLNITRPASLSELQAKLEIIPAVGDNGENLVTEYDNAETGSLLVWGRIGDKIAVNKVLPYLKGNKVPVLLSVEYSISDIILALDNAIPLGNLLEADNFANRANKECKLATYVRTTANTPTI